MENNEKKQVILQAAEKKQEQNVDRAKQVDEQSEAIKGAIDELRSRTETEEQSAEKAAVEAKPKQTTANSGAQETVPARENVEGTGTRASTQANTQPAQPPVHSDAVPISAKIEETSVTANTEDKPAPQNNLLIFGQQPVLPYSIEEAINRLRINISFLGSDVKKIMIVSSEPNEGKSFTTLNLWKQMAIAGERSILLDLDMRKSTMAVKYGLQRADGKELKGTSHFLSGDDPIEDMILHTDMEYGDILPNVDNIVNPSMLLESRKFAEMMKYMEDHYRYVFVDVPPLGLVSDGELIGSVCDGAVLCVRAGVTSRNIVRRSIRQLERAGCPVLGITLNRVGAAGSKYYSKYYGKKYYYNDQYYSKG